MPALVPMQLVHNLAAEHPGLLQHCARFVADFGEYRGKTDDWPAWRLFPIAPVYQYLGTPPGVDTTQEALSAYNICAWRQTQGVYRIDPDVRDALCASEPGRVPWEVFRWLPEWCVFVEVEADLGFGHWHGFFAQASDSGLILTEARRNKIGEMTTTTIVVSREGSSLKDSFKTWDDRDVAGAAERYCWMMVSLLLLLCSEEPDFRGIDGCPESPRNPLLRRGRNGRLFYPIPKRPIVWHTGKSLGDRLRSANHRAASSGQSVAPHLRRGHWHGYWVGPMAEPEKRRLVPRWVSPILVHKMCPGDVPWEPRERVVK